MMILDSYNVTTSRIFVVLILFSDDFIYILFCFHLVNFMFCYISIIAIILFKLMEIFVIAKLKMLENDYNWKIVK